MKRIKELLVLEGKHDKARISQLFDCDVVLTNGLALDDKTLEFIKEAAGKRGVIVFTDPDAPGEKIRKKIMEVAPEAKHCFIDKKRATGKRNVGIEYGEAEALIEALENVVSFENKTETLSREQYLSLGLMGNKEKRAQVAEKLHLGLCNNKTLFKRLNMMGITEKDIKELLK